MSKGYNNSGLHVDTGLLRDHVSKLREEKKLASRLYENVAAMKFFADPMVADRYGLLLQDINQMIEYFCRMANQLASVGDEAVQLSQELKGLIEDSTDLTQHITTESFAL